MNSAARKAYYVRFNRVHAKAEKSVYGIVLAKLQTIGAEVLATFEQSDIDTTLKAADAAIKDRDFATLFIDSYSAESSRFRAFLLDNFEKKIEKKGVLEDAIINIGFFSQRFQNIVTSFAAQMAAERVGKICENLRTLLRNTLTNASTNNATKQQAAKEVKKVWKEVSKGRALLIARTETTTISGFAQMETAKEFNIELDKVWISARDSRTRSDHRSADGNRVKYEEDFDIGGVKMSHPGDPKGGAANCCNCRCTVAFVPRKSLGPLR